VRTKKVKSIPLQVYLSEKESLELTKYCLDNDESKSEVVREALAAYFRQQTELSTATDGNRLVATAV
jgi:hypothetical protein